MSKIGPARNETDMLMEMEKYWIDERAWHFLASRKEIRIPLASTDKKEQLLLGVR